MQQIVQTIIPGLIEQHHERLLDGWLACQKQNGFNSGQIAGNQLVDQSRRFLVEVRKGSARGQFDNPSAPEWNSTCELLNTVASERAVLGYSPSETAVFVFSLK